MRVAELRSKTKISIIDDNESFRLAMVGLMESLGFTVQAFQSAAAFLASPNVSGTSCVIADVRMPHMTGLELHSRLVNSGRAIPMILITAYPDECVRARAMTEGVICYLSKPLDEDALLGCVCTALKRAKLHPAP